MSRTLKFRAWDKKNKKWISKGFHIIGETTVFDMLKQWKDYHDLMSLNDIEVTQFTGLQDNNKKDIYEGDIVLLGEWNFAEVVWYGGGFKWQWDGVRNTTARVQLIPDDGKCYSCRTTEKEILGNIFETPEILKIGFMGDYNKLISKSYGYYIQGDNNV